MYRWARSGRPNGTFTVSGGAGGAAGERPEWQLGLPGQPGVSGAPGANPAVPVTRPDAPGEASPARPASAAETVSLPVVTPLDPAGHDRPAGQPGFAPLVAAHPLAGAGPPLASRPGSRAGLATGGPADSGATMALAAARPAAGAGGADPGSAGVAPAAVRPAGAGSAGWPAASGLPAGHVFAGPAADDRLAEIALAGPRQRGGTGPDEPTGPGGWQTSRPAEHDGSTVITAAAALPPRAHPGSGPDWPAVASTGHLARGGGQRPRLGPVHRMPVTPVPPAVPAPRFEPRLAVPAPAPVPVPAAMAPAVPVSAIPGPASPGPAAAATEADPVMPDPVIPDPAALDRLAQQLYGRLRGHLAAELLGDRERAQLLTDL
jgi:hypothetical protein